MTGPAEVMPAMYGGYHDGGDFAAGRYGPSRAGREQQSTEDFVTRTERSRARALQQYQSQQYQMHQQDLRERRQQQQQPHAVPPPQEHSPQRQQQANKPHRWSLETPATDPAAIVESLPDSPPRPAVYNTPRRLSNASNTSASTAVTAPTRDSFESRMRSPGYASSTTSFTSFDSFFSAQSMAAQQAPGPGRSAWQRPALLKQRRKARPGEQFAALPGEVLELILDELKKLHLVPGSMSCATCWMRDACSVAVSARKWLKFARTALYEDVQLVGADSAIHKKKYKGVVGTRLVLLRRTLRANPLLAATVRTLKVPATPPGVPVEEYQNIVATLVMACPNLERVVGFYPTYAHSFGRFFHALSTRHRLKEMNWILQPSPFQRQQRIRKQDPAPEDQGGAGMIGLQGQRSLVTPGDLQPQQTIAWMQNHTGWCYLSTLTIHCAPGATLTPDTLLIDTLSALPALQTLNLSHLPHNAFNDAGLLSLPPLKKLSLAHLPGISSAGVSAFATHPASRSLEVLTLVHIGLDSLGALARILSNLAALDSLSLVQSYPPTLPADEFIWLFPYLASVSLTRLHWDIPTMFGQANAADSILAKSIAAGGFPSLRRLRAPADPEGVFQALCRPRERVDLPSDRYRQRPGQQHSHSYSGSIGHGSIGLGGGAHSRNGSNASSQFSETGSRRGGAFASPTSPRFPPEIDLEPRLNSDLHQARMAAQARLDAARQLPKFFVNVVDEDGRLVEKYGLAGFMGTVGSKISYHLLPDRGGVDEKGGLVDMEDLLGGGGEDLTCSSNSSSSTGGTAGSLNGLGGPPPAISSGRETPSKRDRDRAKERDKEKNNKEEPKVREGCQGRWNTYSGAVIDKKDKERWFHTERGRWRAVTLS